MTYKHKDHRGLEFNVYPFYITIIIYLPIQWFCCYSQYHRLHLEFHTWSPQYNHAHLSRNIPMDSTVRLKYLPDIPNMIYMSFYWRTDTCPVEIYTPLKWNKTTNNYVNIVMLISMNCMSNFITYLVQIKAFLYDQYYRK